MKRLFCSFLALALALSLTGCGKKAPDPSQPPQADSSQGWVNPRLNQYTLTRLRMSGRGEASEDYKLAFFQPETLEGAEAFLVCYSVEPFDKVWDYLEKLSYQEIADLDKPVNRAYFITDLSYCDGVGNTLNSDQKDLVTGEPFSEAGTHYFYAATVGKDGLLALEQAPQTMTISPTAGKLDFDREGSVLTGSFRSTGGGDIVKNYVFASTEGYQAVRQQLDKADPQTLEQLVTDGSALAFENRENTDFTLDLSTVTLLNGESWDRESCCYVYVASVSGDALLGISSADRLVTPDALPLSSGAIGDGQGVIFPNGGAASIGGGRSSIISASQAIFEHFPDTPRIAVLGGSSGSEKELWGHFYLDTDAKDSFRTRFAQAGFEPVYIPLTADNRDIIGNDPYFAALVSSCHGVYFTGGDQSLGMTSLLDGKGGCNAVGRAVLDLFDRGGFLAGTSAGAHMLGNICFQDADSHEILTHPVPTRAEVSAEGVHCGPEGAVYDGLPCAVEASGHSLVFDSHFGARGRLARLAVMQGSTGADFAIGLDEATGLAVSGGVGTVYGSGTVTILDNSGAEYTGNDKAFGVKGLKLVLLSPGDRFDFNTGAVTPSRAKSPAAPSLEPEQPKDLLGDSSVQARAVITLALSGQQEQTYPLDAGGQSFTAVLNKTGSFAAFAGQRTYSGSGLTDLTQTTVSGMELDILPQ